MFRNYSSAEFSPAPNPIVVVGSKKKTGSSSSSNCLCITNHHPYAAAADARGRDFFRALRESVNRHRVAQYLVGAAFVEIKVGISTVSRVNFR